MTKQPLMIGLLTAMILMISAGCGNNNGGQHPYRIKQATTPLSPGKHKIRIDYIERILSARALLSWMPENQIPPKYRPIPAKRLVPLGGNANYSCP